MFFCCTSTLCMFIPEGYYTWTILNNLTFSYWWYWSLTSVSPTSTYWFSCIRMKQLCDSVRLVLYLQKDLLIEIMHGLNLEIELEQNFCSMLPWQHSFAPGPCNKISLQAVFLRRLLSGFGDDNVLTMLLWSVIPTITHMRHTSGLLLNWMTSWESFNIKGNM